MGLRLMVWTERLAATVFLGQGTIGMDFGNSDRELVLVRVDKIPGVAGQFSFHIVQQRRGAEQMKVLFSSQEDAQEDIEPHEVVHVGVTDEDLTDLKKLSGREVAQISQIKKDGAFVEKKGDEKDGVLERAVDGPRVK